MSMDWNKISDYIDKASDVVDAVKNKPDTDLPMVDLDSNNKSQTNKLLMFAGLLVLLILIFKSTTKKRR